jgi:hypothetical protein
MASSILVITGEHTLPFLAQVVCYTKLNKFATPSVTLRMVTVVKELPDQDELRASQVEGPPTKVEASERPYMWQAEEMVVDDECEISFETSSQQEEKKKHRVPIGITRADGTIELSSQAGPSSQRATSAAESRNAAQQHMRTFTYSLPPDTPRATQEPDGRSDRERLRLAAVSR